MKTIIMTLDVTTEMDKGEKELGEIKILRTSDGAGKIELFYTIDVPDNVIVSLDEIKTIGVERKFEYIDGIENAFKGWKE